MKVVLLLTAAFLFSCSSAREEKKKETENKKETPAETSTGSEQDPSAGAFKTISTDEFEKQIQQPCTILDVRTPEETAEGIIANAVEMDINNPDFSEQIKTLDKTNPVCVYCRSGGRSARAAYMLTQLGYTVYNLDGGFMGWTSAGKPSVKK